MAEKTKQLQQEKARVSLEIRIQRISKAFELISEGVDNVTDDSNEPMPGRVADGLSELMRWAGRELETLANGLPEGGAR